MKKLILCEKPSLAKSVASALNINTRKNNYYENDNYVISYAFGHLFELYDVDDYLMKKNKWANVKLPFIPPTFTYKVRNDDGVKRQFELMHSLAKRADIDTIIHCGDADREGEIIVRNVIMHFDENKPILRLWLNDQTPQTILEQLSKCESDNKYDSLANEGYARTYLDWLLGINLTRFITLKKSTLMACGRVIIPIVKFIYDRDKEIDNFIPRNYYVLVHTIEKDHNKLDIEYKKEFETIDEAFRAKLNQNDIIVSNVTNKKSIKPAKKLFSLSTLQQELNRNYGYSFAMSLDIIQKLYEFGYITYPRTNTEYLSENEKDKIKEIITKLQARFNIIFKDNKKIFDSSKVESHSAITITNKVVDYNKLPEVEKNVYLTVLKRFIANFSKEECIVSKTTITFKIGDYLHESSGETILEKGWMKYENEKNDKILPNLLKGETFKANFEFKEKKSTSPKKVTETTLSNYLKNPFRKKDTTEDEEYRAILSGVEIGTEATRTGIIENAIKYGYIQKNKSSFSIMDKGIELIETLDLLNIDLYATKTVEFSILLKKIYKNESTIEDLINKTTDELKAIINQARKVPMLPSGMKIESFGNCPLCNAPIFVSNSAYYCSNGDHGCRFELKKHTSFFDNYLCTPLTDKIAKDLFTNKVAFVELMSKEHKPYQIKVTYEVKNGYLNFKKDYINTKETPSKD